MLLADGDLIGCLCLIAGCLLLLVVDVIGQLIWAEVVGDLQEEKERRLGSEPKLCFIEAPVSISRSKRKRKCRTYIDQPSTIPLGDPLELGEILPMPGGLDELHEVEDVHSLHSGEGLLHDICVFEGTIGNLG